jgi:hypothetical protein
MDWRKKYIHLRGGGLEELASAGNVLHGTLLPGKELCLLYSSERWLNILKVDNDFYTMMSSS